MEIIFVSEQGTPWRTQRTASARWSKNSQQLILELEMEVTIRRQDNADKTQTEHQIRYNCNMRPGGTFIEV